MSNNEMLIKEAGTIVDLAKNLDFAARSKDREPIGKLFQDLGYKEDRQVSVWK